MKNIFLTLEDIVRFTFYKAKQQLSKELQLPEEVILNSGEVKPVRRTKKGHGYVPLLESEIREAQSKTVTAADAARYLKVSYKTLRKLFYFV